ncbi:hypothetical protein HID58_003304 [Brassica napus]|uniref:Uncharacterized protein n=1 Tax=Brassica napus TaxID=3708 RepID=A0ABQ8EPQ9_BRANA|nr:hypothetical protein HID58_003304 [Brassica napus]
MGGLEIMKVSTSSSAEESDVTDLDFPVYEKEEEETLKERKRRAVRESSECEKKAKKKAAANSSSPPELDRAINELEEVRALDSGKEKQRSIFPRESFRYKHPGRGTEALPKAILNRRKAHKYSPWGLLSAALALALCLLFLFLQ